MLKISRLGLIALVVMVAFATSGCALGFYKRSPKDIEKIADLRAELDRLQLLREQENSELQAAKAELEKRLKGAKGVSVGMDERGLVVTFVAEVLFDSGLAKIRPSADELLDKVVNVINDQVADRNIAIEGHTDNEPIKKSGWKSNWELSTARATSVLHYLEGKGTTPNRLQATGYGEYRPIASNDMKEGRQKNRRVEIIILPKMSKAETEFLKEHEKDSEYIK